LVPRYLVSEEKYDDRKEWTERAIKDFQPDDFNIFLAWDGIVKSNDHCTICGRIFSICAAVDGNVEEDSVHNDDLDDSPIIIGYDGSGINYGKCKISIISEYVWKKLMTKDRE
jgi:hypothetical protein